MVYGESKIEIIWKMDDLFFDRAKSEVINIPKEA